jgi:hypothetical protein
MELGTWGNFLGYFKIIKHWQPNLLKKSSPKLYYVANFHHLGRLPIQNGQLFSGYIYKFIFDFFDFIDLKLHETSN